jgi:Ca-activated chloride channel family protein
MSIGRLISNGRAVAVFCAVAVLPVLAQDRGPRLAVQSEFARARVPETALPIRLDVKSVLIPVSVTDDMDRPVAGIHKQRFRLFEDGVEQRITEVSNEDAPISVGVVFDISGSMEKKLDQSREAVRELVRLSMPGDEFFLTVFNELPKPVFGFTADPLRIEDGLAGIRADGGTALFDALYLATHQMKIAGRARKVVLVLSDGKDNSSRYTEREVKALLREADVRIFAVSMMDRSRVLEEVAEESGGRAYRVRRLEELPALAARLSAEMHNHYVLSYTPSNPANDGRYRRVKVELIPAAGEPQLHATWRRGYYGPTQ